MFMDKISSKLKVTLSALLLSSLLLVVYSLSSKEEYCPVIDDLRKVDAIKAVNTFSLAKIHYFVDLQHSYQILVVKWQVEEAYAFLNNIGITARSHHQSSCKVVH